MRTVLKGAEPNELRSFRLSKNAQPTYDAYRKKPQLLRRLSADQGNLCCYCMGSLIPERSSIEHWKSKTRYPDKQLDWSNLFAVCPGNAGSPPALQHCDELKADRDFQLYPCDTNLSAKVGYSASGKVIALKKDTLLQGDIDNVVGLNRERLIQNRNSALRAMVEACARRNTGEWSPEYISRELDRLMSRDCGVPYCGFLIWWLTQRLTRAKRARTTKPTKSVTRIKKKSRPRSTSR